MPNRNTCWNCDHCPPYIRCESGAEIPDLNTTLEICRSCSPVERNNWKYGAKKAAAILRIWGHEKGALKIEEDLILLDR